MRTRDATDLNDLKRTLGECTATLRNIAVLVNNVADDDRHALETIDPDYFNWEISINLRQHVFAAQAVIAGSANGLGALGS